ARRSSGSTSSSASRRDAAPGVAPTPRVPGRRPHHLVVSGLVLAVDGGNSKTDVALCSADGTVLAAVRRPTPWHPAVGLVPGLDRLDELVSRVAVAAGRPADRPVADVVSA